jgi:hypothetical protein
MDERKLAVAEQEEVELVEEEVKEGQAINNLLTIDFDKPKTVNTMTLGGKAYELIDFDDVDPITQKELFSTSKQLLAFFEQKGGDEKQIEAKLNKFIGTVLPSLPKKLLMDKAFKFAYKQRIVNVFSVALREYEEQAQANN